MNPVLEGVFREALEVARWAPSSHNSQPWRIVPLPDAGAVETLFPNRQPEAGGGHVLITLDSRRCLRALPSLQQEMYLSCGMFTGLLCMALQWQGVAWRLEWPDADRGPALRDFEASRQCRVVVLLSLLPPSHGDSACAADPRRLERLLHLARHRKTRRGPFQSRAPEHGAIAELLVSAWPNSITGDLLRVHLERDPGAIVEVARQVAHFAALDFSSYRVWKETYGYLRFGAGNDAADGFYLRCLFGPTGAARRWLLRWMLLPPVIQALRPCGVPRRIAGQLAALVAQSPLLLFATLDVEHLNATALVQAGVRLMELWLKAESLNIGFHPVSVMLQHASASAALQATAGLGGRVVFFARAGSVEGPGCDSPRRPAADLVATA